LLAADDRIKLRGIYDPAAVSVEATTAKFPDITVHTSLESLLADPQIAWVIVGSWNSQHCAQVCAAFEANKHVFCEKPMATSLADCLKIRDAWRASGRRFSLGLVLRYSPHYQKIRQVVESGTLGRIISMEFNETLHFAHGGFIHGDWRRLTRHAGSHLLEKCCHDLDLANWIVNSLPRRVASFGGCDFFTPENAGLPDALNTSFSTWKRVEDHDPFTADKDIVDNQVAIIEYYNQTRATFHTNCSTNMPERRMYLCGSRATLRADVIAGTIELCPLGNDQSIERLDAGVQGGHGGADEHMAVGLARTMIDDAAPLAGVHEGICSTVSALGIDQAMEQASVVDLDAMWRGADVEPRA
jgi:predicted dehydrogenase